MAKKTPVVPKSMQQIPRIDTEEIPVNFCKLKCRDVRNLVVDAGENKLIVFDHVSDGATHMYWIIKSRVKKEWQKVHITTRFCNGDAAEYTVCKPDSDTREQGINNTCVSKGTSSYQKFYTSENMLVIWGVPCLCICLVINILISSNRHKKPVLATRVQASTTPTTPAAQK